MLTSGHNLLRPWTLGDLDFVLAAARDPQISRFSSVGLATNALEARRWISSRASSDRMDWVIDGSGDPIGRVSLAYINPEDGVAEIGYWVLPAHRRRGVATTAVAAVEQHAYGSMRLRRLVIRHELENSASCALASSRGYQAEGTQRAVFVRRGEPRDLHVHALLDTDLAARDVLGEARGRQPIGRAGQPAPAPTE